MEKNLDVYSSRQVLDWYSRLHEIIPVEKKIFESYREIIEQSDLLDIGIGGGRTTAYLLPVCKHYTGIDYAAGFIDVVRKDYPRASCFVQDARDLSAFGNNRFDFVNFSFNGIDYVDLEGRKKILSEISRVLKPGGIFFFSTHNKAHNMFNKNPWRNTGNTLLINVKTFVKLLPFFGKKLRQKKNEIIEASYAIINDSAHNYSLMTFYTTPRFLRDQLTEAGFGEITCYARSGEKKEDEELEDWIFVTAKKISV